MALRLHSHNLNIENAEHAYVYTTPPSTVRKLVKQRVRWTTGFLLNVRDYRHMLLQPQTRPDRHIHPARRRPVARHRPILRRLFTGQCRHFRRRQCHPLAAHRLDMALAFIPIVLREYHHRAPSDFRPRRLGHRLYLLRQAHSQRLMEAVEGHGLLCPFVWFYSTDLGGYLMVQGADKECGELEVGKAIC